MTYGLGARATLLYNGDIDETGEPFERPLQVVTHQKNVGTGLDNVMKWNAWYYVI